MQTGERRERRAPRWHLLGEAPGHRRRVLVAALVALGLRRGAVARATDPPRPPRTVDVIVRRDPAAAIDLDALVRVGGRHGAPDAAGDQRRRRHRARRPDRRARGAARRRRGHRGHAPSPSTRRRPPPAGPRGTPPSTSSSRTSARRTAAARSARSPRTTSPRSPGPTRRGSTATGQGIDVALIDSGVLPVPGMGTVVNGPDLSFESQAPELRHLDSFGHGTHLAGIINGNGEGIRGLAPDARVVNVKVAASNGAADVSQVIAAIDWVGAAPQPRRPEHPGAGPRVRDRRHPAVRARPARLRRRGGVAARDRRRRRPPATRARRHRRSTNPARDPFVIAVGASEPHGTFTTGDDTVAEFSNRGQQRPRRRPGRSRPLAREPPGARAPSSTSATPRGGSATGSSAAAARRSPRRWSRPPPRWCSRSTRATRRTTSSGSLEKTAKTLPMADAQAQGAGTVDLRKAVEHAASPPAPTPPSAGRRAPAPARSTPPAAPTA